MDVHESRFVLETAFTQVFVIQFVFLKENLHLVLLLFILVIVSNLT